MNTENKTKQLTTFKHQIKVVISQNQSKYATTESSINKIYDLVKTT